MQNVQELDETLQHELLDRNRVALLEAAAVRVQLHFARECTQEYIDRSWTDRCDRVRLK